MIPDVRTYLRQPRMPHILCPGCGHGIVLGCLLRAVHALGIHQDRLAVVAGIGCSSRLAGYVDACTLHTTHGRALAFATGLKLARPELTVVVLTGDGDGLSIGGGHLVHAARRNVGITCILFNNAVYGMTGGQVAPTTQPGWRASTAPYGHVEPAFDGCALVQGAGGTFVARGLAYDPLGLEAMLKEALRHEGFSYVEVLTDCPVYFGRYNRLGEGADLLWSQKARFTEVGGMLADKRFVTQDGTAPPGYVEGLRLGILHRSQRPEFSRVCWEVASKGGAR